MGKEMNNAGLSEIDLAKLRKGAEKVQNKKNIKSAKKSLPELEHELTVYEIELKMQNISLFNTLEKLTAAYTEYEMLFELSPVGYFILSREGTIKKVNERGAEQFGVSKLFLLNRPFSTFLNSEFEQDNFYRHMNQVIEDGKPGRMECEINKSGKPFFVALIQTRVVKNEQLNFKHLLLMVSDI